MPESLLDLEKARRLVDAIAGDLAAIPQDDARHAQVRAEIAQLKAMLSGARVQPSAIEAGLRSAHARVDRASEELHADGVRAALFLQGVGRMLGLD